MRLQRLAETDRPAVSFMLDGAPVAALEGDSLLTAILAQDGGYLRASEFGDGLRAGFCLMGACQDCWVNVEGGGRVRACTTPIAEGMRVSRRIAQP
ncbi:(2Fe-2S)-binding protein [Bradyrhizobium manausense]|uniref:(2Fe-2S)-binding protein n=1 Tax=Bradyrhizobium TaxID=374 RepID=UPI001BA95B74|nr:MULTISPECIES: (2Fe-2S)-binding protein [Bradyrhizobium]MBR0827772.1 (2Fe-2S)-binding protein [Bradyrhizobium manausense]UVO26244.1 (2Fe-2S)-binding protein [Bradyrhizobium arachidis]